MPASPYGNRQVCLACELYGSDHVGDLQRSRHNLRAAIDHAVERGPRCVVAAIVPRDDRAPVPTPEISD